MVITYIYIRNMGKEFSTSVCLAWEGETIGKQPQLNCELFLHLQIFENIDGCRFFVASHRMAAMASDSELGIHKFLRRIKEEEEISGCLSDTICTISDGKIIIPKNTKCQIFIIFPSHHTGYMKYFYLN